MKAAIYCRVSSDAQEAEGLRRVQQSLLGQAEMEGGKGHGPAAFSFPLGYIEEAGRRLRKGNPTQAMYP